jgi:hypothetical protein
MALAEEANTRMALIAYLGRRARQAREEKKACETWAGLTAHALRYFQVLGEADGQT